MDFTREKLEMRLAILTSVYFLKTANICPYKLFYKNIYIYFVYNIYTALYITAVMFNILHVKLIIIFYVKLDEEKNVNHNYISIYSGNCFTTSIFIIGDW